MWVEEFVLINIFEKFCLNSFKLTKSCKATCIKRWNELKANFMKFLNCDIEALPNISYKKLFILLLY